MSTPTGEPNMQVCDGCEKSTKRVWFFKRAKYCRRCEIDIKRQIAEKKK